ncbi:DNRLRE domain-containing protein [Nonomuraea sp. NPDC059007]|uniref:DNRLRE domain-containing protein n=1 Tax=Nonomuraea sp. NPDC059007 TaxID=3346692 RepID=UPI0036741ADB
MLIGEETTESSASYANPDGTITVETASDPVRVRQGDGWVPIDMSLVKRGAALTPKAAGAEFSLEFSPGGAGPFAKMTRADGKFIALSWPSPLPAPRIEGTKAIYAGAAGIPGADLVVTALPTGFRHDVVLRERPAGPVEFRMLVQNKGLSLAEDRQGGLTVTDSKGKPVASAPEPVMYDSPDTQAKPGAETGKIDTKVVVKNSQRFLVLRPDANFLADPDTRYPVTVDPTITLTSTAKRTILGPYSTTSSLADTVVGNFDDSTRREFSRVLLKFDTSSLSGKTVTDAKLQLTSSDSWGCVAAQNIKAQRITSAWTASSTYWANQPSTTTSGEQQAQQPGQCSSDSSVPEGTWTWPITDIAKAWSGGAAGHGVMLRLVTEHPVLHENQYSRSFSTPTLVVTYGSTPSIENVRTAPVSTNAGTVYTNTTKPTLFAFTKDPDSGLLRVDFDVEHDPAAPSQGSGQVWTGAVDGVSAGAEAKVSVPAGQLADGGKYRWRARAFDGTDQSAWSSWRSFTVDATAPEVPAIECPIPEGAWASPVSSDEYTCMLSGTGDTNSFWWGLDDPSTPALAKLTSGNSNYALDLDKISQGWHTLYVKSRDRAHNRSEVVAYAFGVTPGGILGLSDESHTFRYLPLSATAPPGRTGVRYEMTNIGVEDFQPLPVGDVSVPGTGTPITGWPQTRTDSSAPFGQLTWDVAKSLRNYPSFAGVVKLRACFTGGPGAGECTNPIEVILDKSAFGGSYGTADVGFGQVALQSGDFSLTVTDASAFDINVARTANTLEPSPEREDELLDENRIFGPGWRAGFPAGLGDADFALDGTDDSNAIQFVGPDGETRTYVAGGSGFVGVGEAADGSRVVVDTAKGTLTLTDRYGTTTTYTRQGISGRWVVTAVESSAAESLTTYTRDIAGRVTRVLAPAAAGVTCGAQLRAGCRALDLSYASTTTATGVGSGWGDFAGQAKQVSFTAFDPVTNAMKTTVMATYAYDSTGHLRKVTDSRTGLETIYYYNAEGRLSQVNPPGLTPWRLEYDNRGRLAHTQREAGDNDLTHAVAYDVPIGGGTAPLDMTSAQTARWGQTRGLPQVGAAAFPPSRTPVRGGDGAYHPSAADWEYGQLTYMDVFGRPVNTASYGAGAWQIGASHFDTKGNIVWSLTADNRAQALTPQANTDPYVAARADTAERANLLATVSVFSPHSDLLTSTKPAHPVLLASGDLVSARQHTTSAYDEGKPSSGSEYHLVTTTTTEPLVLDGTSTPGPADVLTNKKGYDPIKAGDPSGWTLRQGTSDTTVMPGQDDIVHRVRYDASGRKIESRMPKSDGTDAGSTISSYYTAGAHPGVAACGNKPQWATLLCQTGPAAQPSGMPLPVSTMTYGYYGQLSGKTQISGATTRTSMSTFDTAGRLSKLKVEVTPAAEGGTPVPEIAYTYDPATGAPTTVSAGGRTVTTGHDTLGRMTTHTDASGNTATYSYDAFGRTATINDGKGTSSFVYDGTDALGKAERRGKATRVDVTGVSSFGYAYDADGRTVSEVLPGGLNSLTRFDNAGDRTNLDYVKNGATWLSFTATSDVMSRTARAGSPASHQRYTYDAAARLTKVQDTYTGACTTRVYGFDKNTNRTSLTTHPSATDGSCSTSTSPTTETHTYDTADRITDPGYSYDNLERVVTVPGTQIAGGQPLTSGYHANDMVASLTQVGRTQTLTHDPLGRILTQSDSAGTATNHYSSGSDSPAWTSEPNGSWTRYLSGPNGMMATLGSDGALELQLANLHGDVVATAGISSTGIDSYAEYSEYGSPRQAAGETQRYGWLGAKQRAADAVGGIVLMGVRLYNPATGRMLQSDPVAGGCANRQDYALQDPINGLDLDGRKCFGGTYRKFDDDRFQSCMANVQGLLAIALGVCAVACAGTLGIGCGPCFAGVAAWYVVSVGICHATSYKTCCKEQRTKKQYDRKCVKKKKGKCVRWRNADTYKEVAYAGPEVCW